MSFGSLFKEAKDSIKGKGILVGIIVFIYMVVAEGLGFVDTIMDVNKILNGTFMNYESSQSFWAMIISFVLQAFVIVGYTTTMLNVARGKNIKLGDMLINWRLGFKAICLVLLETIYIMLWGFVFVIPAIVKIYSYSMALYILVENPNKGLNECITESREMMDGYKFDLFAIELCFAAIGFVIGLVLVGVIVLPYLLAANLMSNSALSIALIAVVGIIVLAVVIYFRSINEVVCAHFYLKIAYKQTYIRPLGDERLEDLNTDNSVHNIIE